MRSSMGNDQACRVCCSLSPPSSEGAGLVSSSDFLCTSSALPLSLVYKWRKAWRVEESVEGGGKRGAWRKAWSVEESVGGVEESVEDGGKRGGWRKAGHFNQNTRFITLFGRVRVALALWKSQAHACPKLLAAAQRLPSVRMSKWFCRQLQCPPMG